MDSKKYLTSSILLSLLFHILLYTAASKITVNAPNPLAQTKTVSKKNLQKVTPKSIRVTPITLPARTEISPSGKFTVNLSGAPTRVTTQLISKSRQTNSPVKRSETSPKTPIHSPEFTSLIKTPTPKIYHIALRSPQKKIFSGITPSVPKLSSLNTHTPLFPRSSSPTPGNHHISIKHTIPKIGIPGFKAYRGDRKTPKRVINTPKSTQQLEQIHKQNHGQMEYFLNITPHTYVDNKNNIGYFRLDLKVNDNAEGLNPLPKDVYFIVDTSRSISNKQLREFKTGVHKGLYSLNKNDRFDIVFFSTKAKAFFKTFTQATSKNIQLAQAFLEKSSNYGKTDIYNSIKPYINDISRANNRPIQLFLLTDGVSTVSKSMKDSALINKITQNNNADVSVFGFSCGPKNNSFLIDFISYRNRGDSLPQRKIKDSGQKLADYIGNYSKIIVADLKYKFMGKHKSNTFPKKLPHLYRQKSLSVFGTFDPSEKETFIQLLGESSSGPRQLIYKLNYSQAIQANEDLAKHWASQKIYHLIGKLIDAPSQIISNEIQELKKKFKVYIPYNLPEIE